jgi:hypothetical protein
MLEMLTRASLDDLGRTSPARLLGVARNEQGNTKSETMQNLQVLNSICSFAIPDIFLFETRFKK